MTLAHTFKSLLVSASVVILAGCATTGQNGSMINPATGKNADQKAQHAALNAQIDAALQRVSEQPRWASSLDDRAAFASFNTNSVNVSYQGSAADLLTAIAASRGKSFKITGPAPHVPIFVFVETKDQQFEEFMRDLSRQFGQRADVVLADSHVELRYR